MKSKGFLILVYLDNGLGFADSEESCNYMSGKVLTDLLSAGFLSNYEKSVWKPQRSLEWLGFVWNLDKWYFICDRFKNAQYFEIFTIDS